MGLLTPANRYVSGSAEYLINAKHAEIEEQLGKQPGRALVLVRYGPRHQIYEELVYNHADIDGSKVVWARSLGAEKDAELIRHYPDREVWTLVENGGVTLSVHGAGQVPVKTVERQRAGLWRRWFGPMPGRREAHAMAWIALVIGVILCGVAVLLGFEGRTFLGRPLGGDFVEFYTIGKILNNYAPARIYDLQLATGLQHATLPSMPDTQMLVFGQAPFIASLFRPFALLPYAWAYVAWLGFSAGLFIAALALLFRTVRLNAEDRKTGFLLALSSTPFLFETWIGGQMSVVVFFIWVLFFWCLENDRRVLAGFVLALCLFKPTLVALPVLMLLVGRRWRVLGGFAGGGIAMALLSVATVGLQGCRAWLQALAMNGNMVAMSGEARHQAKNVDVLAFSHLLFAGWPGVADLVAIAVAVIAVSWLGLAWWRSDARTMNRPPLGGHAVLHSGG